MTAVAPDMPGPTVGPVAAGPTVRGALGFACLWDADQRRTWSGTPFALREAMRAHDDVVDIGVRLPAATRTALKLAHARRSGGRWVSMWKHTRAAERLVDRSLRRGSADAAQVLTVQDLGDPGVPFWIYQDLSYDALLRLRDVNGQVPHFPSLTPDTMRRRAERQRALYARADGILAMSGWFADSLVADSDVPREKITVVHPGATTTQDGTPPEREALERRLARRRHRLLFLGRDFATKGGAQVLAAVDRLAARGLPVTLTVVGPTTWPGAAPPSPCVEFLGAVPAVRVPHLLDEHDLLVLPSVLEGFGIVFVEALSRGVPCIGRRAFAMPEIIRPGVSGGLVDSHDPADLADLVEQVLADDAVYAATAAAADSVREHYTWLRAAREVRHALGRVD